MKRFYCEIQRGRNGLWKGQWKGKYKRDLITVPTGKCRRNRHHIKTVQCACPLRNEATGNEPETQEHGIDVDTQEHGIDVDHHMWSRGQPHLHHQVNIELVRDEWLGLQFGGRTIFSLFIYFCCWRDVVYKEAVSHYLENGNDLLFGCFLDLSKANDRVSHPILFKKMLERGTPAFIVKNFEKLV